MRIVLGVLTLFFLPYCAFGQEGEAVSGRPPLKIAAVLSLTGPASVHGESMRKGIELAQRELKIEGRPVSVAVEDDGTAPLRTVSVVKSLTARGYKFFVGPTWSYLVESAGPVFQREGVLALAPAVSSEEVGGIQPAVFFGTGKSQYKLKPVIEWLRAQQVKKAAIVYASSRWGEVHGALYKQAAAAAGVEIVALETFNYGDEEGSIPIILTKLRGLDVDALLTTSSKEGAAKIFRVMSELKMRAKLLSTEDLLDAARAGILPAADGRTAAYSLALVTLPDFALKYRQAFGEEPYIYADSAYDAVRLLTRAYYETDGSVGAVSKYLEDLKGYSGLSGVWVFDRGHDVQKGAYEIRTVR